MYYAAVEKIMYNWNEFWNRRDIEIVYLDLQVCHRWYIHLVKPPGKWFAMDDSVPCWNLWPKKPFQGGEQCSVGGYLLLLGGWKIWVLCGWFVLFLFFSFLFISFPFLFSIFIIYTYTVFCFILFLFFSVCLKRQGPPYFSPIETYHIHWGWVKFLFTCSEAVELALAEDYDALERVIPSLPEGPWSFSNWLRWLGVLYLEDGIPGVVSSWQLWWLVSPAK